METKRESDIQEICWETPTKENERVRKGEKKPDPCEEKVKEGR